MERANSTAVRLRNMTSLYIINGERALCLYRVGSRVADRKYIGTAGGHFECWELNDPYACVLREAWEELGLREDDILDLRLRYVTHRLKNGEIRQNYYYFGSLNTSKDLHSIEGTLRWVSFSEFPELDMPVSAKHMILHYIEKGRHDRVIYAGITQEWGTEFYPLEEFP